MQMLTYCKRILEKTIIQLFNRIWCVMYTVPVLFANIKVTKNIKSNDLPSVGIQSRPAGSGNCGIAQEIRESNNAGLSVRDLRIRY